MNLHIQTKIYRRRADRAGEDVMSVIENNGEVTLPGSQRDPMMTKRRVLSALTIVGTLAALAWVVLVAR